VLPQFNRKGSPSHSLSSYSARFRTAWWNSSFHAVFAPWTCSFWRLSRALRFKRCTWSAEKWWSLSLRRACFRRLRFLPSSQLCSCRLRGPNQCLTYSCLHSLVACQSWQRAPWFLPRSFLLLCRWCWLQSWWSDLCLHMFLNLSYQNFSFVATSFRAKLSSKFLWCCSTF